LDGVKGKNPSLYHFKTVAATKYGKDGQGEVFLLG